MINSQGERLEIKTVEKENFKGEKVIIIYDDVDAFGGVTKAVHLLDERTRKYLLEQLNH